MKENRKGLSIAIIVLFVGASVMPNVSVSGNDPVSGNTIYVPDDYPTIQDAIDNASNGDTIIVRDGTYTENVDVNKRLTIQSENGFDVTIVQAANSSDHVFEVRADYVNISGFTVTGATESSRFGVYFYYAEYCNISNNNVSNNYYGIYLFASNTNTLTNNTVNSNRVHGISLYSSSNNVLTNNIANSNNVFYGIFLYSSSSNNLTNNTANSNKNSGIALSFSSSNTLTGNTANSNKIDGITIRYTSNNNVLKGNNATNNPRYSYYIECDSCNNDIDTSNIGGDVGKPFLFVTNISGYKVNDTDEYSEIEFCNVQDSLIDNVTVSNLDTKSDGIIIFCSNNITVKNSDSSNNYRGFYLDDSSNCTLTNNTAHSNKYDGIYLRYSSNNSISGNNISPNNQNGIYLLSSSNYNIVSNNTASNNQNGIYLLSSSNNTVSNNTASNNHYGIHLFYSGTNNTITNNDINSNNYGIHVWDSSNNNLIYNNYFNNTNNAYDECNNIWSITKTLGTNIIGGPYLGGNYWSDYTGEDTNGDGLGDTPYLIPGGNNQDKYPLMYPYGLCHITDLLNNWNLVSLPFNQSVDKTDFIVRCNDSYYSWQEAVNNGFIVDFIYEWNRSIQNYEIADTLDPGYGYWMYAYHNCELLAKGVSNIIDDNFITDLLTNWNIVGVPHNKSLYKYSIIIRYNGTDYSWHDATTDNNEEGEPLILGHIYGWDTDKQHYILSDAFAPKYGYWMYAYYNCSLKRNV